MVTKSVIRIEITIGSGIWNRERSSARIGLLYFRTGLVIDFFFARFFRKLVDPLHFFRHGKPSDPAGLYFENLFSASSLRTSTTAGDLAGVLSGSARWLIPVNYDSAAGNLWLYGQDIERIFVGDRTEEYVQTSNAASPTPRVAVKLADRYRSVWLVGTKPCTFREPKYFRQPCRSLKFLCNPVLQPKALASY